MNMIISTTYMSEGLKGASQLVKNKHKTGVTCGTKSMPSGC